MSRQESQLDYVNQDRLRANPLYVPPLFPLFDGPTYNEELDGERLSGQHARVFACMSDGKARTLREIQAITGGSETAISARLRDFRKKRFGSHTVDPTRRGEGKNGVWEYRLIVNRLREDQ